MGRHPHLSTRPRQIGEVEDSAGQPDQAVGRGAGELLVLEALAADDRVFRALADRVREEFLALQERVDVSSPARTARDALDAYLTAYTRHFSVLTVIAH